MPPYSPATRAVSPAGPRPRAFTLIELLVVIAVIAILAMIAVPNFLDAQLRAKVASATCDMESLGAALEAYQITHHAYPPNWIDLTPVDPAALAQPAGPKIVPWTRLVLEDGRWLCETEASALRRLGAPATAATSAPVAASPSPPGLLGGYQAAFDSYAYVSRPGMRLAQAAFFYNGAALRRLTTPVAWVAGFPRDPFAGDVFARPFASPSSAAGPEPTLWEIAPLRPYGYYNLTALHPDGVALQGFGRTLPWILMSDGPDVHPSLIHPLSAFPALYDPTNGATSDGDLVVLPDG